MILRRLRGRGSAELPARLARLMAPYKSWNAFNPSVLVDGSTAHLVFRAFRHGERIKPFNAYYISSELVDDAPDVEPVLIDLTEHARLHGVSVVADPKLVRLGGEVVVTFNTGSSAGAPNDIYLMQLTPSMGVPQRCVLEPRHRVEKNWAFYEHDGFIRALYSIDPLVRLRLVSGQLGDAKDLFFERDPRDAEASVSFTGGRFKRNLSMGTQPVASDGRLLLIAHEKLYVHKFFGYLGRVVVLDALETAHPRARISRQRLVHSIRSSLPRRGEHNREALFVTYFCGLIVRDDALLVSYGINDTGYGFAEIDMTCRGAGGI